MDIKKFIHKHFNYFFLLYLTIYCSNLTHIYHVLFIIDSSLIEKQVLNYAGDSRFSVVFWPSRPLGKPSFQLSRFVLISCMRCKNDRFGYYLKQSLTMT